MFNTEEKMVKFCVEKLDSIFNSIDAEKDIILEPAGLFGRPDIMINGDEIICIEAKLRNWKRAIRQAYRYKSFSEESYVFMDEAYIDSPLKNIEEFKKYNIGLCGVSKESINVYYKPLDNKPFSEELYNKAKQLFEPVPLNA